MSIGDRIKQRREKLNMSAEELGTTIGKAKTTVYRYETGYIEKMPTAILEPIAQALRTTPAYLMGWTDDPTYSVSDAQQNIQFSATANKRSMMADTKKVPLVGTIACGAPVLADENIECWMGSPSKSADFCLRCKGDSMIGARINDGDIVFLRQQPDVDDGQIAAVLIGDEAILKRCYHTNDGFILQAENPKYPTRIVSGEEVRILGLAVGFHSDII